MRIIKSVGWLVGCGTLGYVLMGIVTPDEAKQRKVLPDGQVQYYSENLKKRQAFVDILRGAAEGRDPMYRQSQAELEANRDKFLGKK